LIITREEIISGLTVPFLYSKGPLELNQTTSSSYISYISLLRTNLKIKDVSTPLQFLVPNGSLECALYTPTLLALSTLHAIKYIGVKRQKKKGKAIPVMGVEAHRVVRPRGSHIF
jgi:hypothetical protein